MVPAWPTAGRHPVADACARDDETACDLGYRSWYLMTRMSVPCVERTLRIGSRTATPVMNALIALVFAIGLGVVSLTLLLLMDRRADRLERERQTALQPAMPEPFDPQVVADLPEPARRYFSYKIRPGTPILPVAETKMRGQFSLGTKEEPNPDKEHRLQPFGATMSDFHEVGGYRLPSRVEAGNLYGTEAYFPFFRAEVTSIIFPGAGP